VAGKRKVRIGRGIRSDKPNKSGANYFVKSILTELEEPLVLWGRHPTFGAINNPLREIYKIFCSENSFLNLHDHIQKINSNKSERLPRVEILSIQELNLLVPVEAVHQGFVVIVRELPDIGLDHFLDQHNTSSNFTLVILDQVTDPHNVGAILRSAAAFGAAGMIVQKRNAPEVDGVLAKSASGATEFLPVFRVTNISRTIRQLQEKEIWCLGLAGEAESSIVAAPIQGRIAVVLGAEGTGLRRLTREVCDQLVHLPTAAHFSTLNVSNAASIVLYEIKRRNLELIRP
jgi:23S rRNA (guanosine2251-2'-O)-methyltransferase